MRGVRDQVVNLVNALAERLGLRLVRDPSGAAGSALSETVFGGRDGERRGGEEHLAEEGDSEHGEEQIRRSLSTRMGCRTGDPELRSVRRSASAFIRRRILDTSLDIQRVPRRSSFGGGAARY